MINGKQKVEEDLLKLVRQYEADIKNLYAEAKIKEQAASTIKTLIGSLKKDSSLNGSNRSSFNDWVVELLSDGYPRTNLDITKEYNKYSKKGYSTDAMSVKIATAVKMGLLQTYKDSKPYRYCLPTWYNDEGDLKREYVEKIKTPELLAAGV